MSTSKRFLAKNGLDNNNNTITNTADPVNAQDVATKAFSSNASNLTSGTIGPGVTIAAITQIINGTSNVNISTSGGDITVTRAGSLQATFASGGLTVNNNTTISNSSARLYVDATGGSDPQVQFLRSSSLNALVGVSSGANNIIVGSTAGDMCLRVVTNDLLISTDNGSTSALTVTASGNVGIGASPARKLDVFGSAQFKDASTIATTVWSEAVSGAGGMGTNSNHPFTILTNGTERMRFTAGGNTMIGTSTDVGYKLYVSGSFAAASGLFAASSGTLTVDSTVATNNALINFQLAEVTKGLLGVSGGTDGIAIGSTQGDIVLNVASNDFHVSTNSGSNIAFSVLSTGNVSVSNNLTVTGNLTVNGTTTTVNSTTMTVDDPVFTLGGDTAPGSDDNKDRGIEFRWHNGTTAKVGFFGFDDSTGKFTFIPDATNTSEVFSGTKGTIDANIDWTNVTNQPTTFAAAAGSAASPSISVRDSGSGLYSSASNTLNVSTAGALAATFASNGDFTAVGNVTAYSDIRLKKDLSIITNAVDKVKQLTGYSYTRIDNNQRNVGLIAQDVQQVMPEAVVDDGKHLSVAYGNLVGLLVEAIKEQQKQIDILTAKLGAI